MRPIRAALVLAAIAGVLAVFGHPVLALAPALAAAPLVPIIVRVVRKRRRQREARIVGVSNDAPTREQRTIRAESVVRTVQLARAEIAHAGAAEARAVLDALERQAKEHPEGIPGPVVAEARMRFDALMRSNIQ